MNASIPQPNPSSVVFGRAPNGLVLYELSAKEDRRFSPFCWKARMALAHRKLTPDYVPVRFTDMTMVAFSGQDRVPVLIDHSVTVADSWNIACYLEAIYIRVAPPYSEGTRDEI